MNRDDIIRMARGAGIISPEETGEVWCAGEWQLHEFAALVVADYQERTKWDGIHTCHAECQRPVCVSIRKAVAAEREACAKVAEAYEPRCDICPSGVSFAIRERGAP